MPNTMGNSAVRVVDRATPDATWRKVVPKYQQPNVRRAIIQTVTTLGLLIVALTVMYLSLALPYWITLLLAVPTAGLLVRTFIIMHDCSHGSFLPWRRANETLGFITGVLTLTPFEQWRRDHALHHASSGDLDRRGHGDVATLTVREYLARSWWGRTKYRMFRNPAVLFGLGPLNLMIGQRFRPRSLSTKDKQARSVWATNAALAVGIAVCLLFFDWRFLVLVYLPAMYIAGAVGIWLFYVQHQFEDAYWQKHDDWDYVTAAIKGSSHFKLPAVLQWFTGNIGLHHVHHLGPRIPNYNLQRCHDENTLFHDASVMTLTRSFAVLRLTLWQEEEQRLVTFSAARRWRNSTAHASPTA
jgi:omega-6 fatty acid desaturase (delta-12 desaturase)